MNRLLLPVIASVFLSIPMLTAADELGRLFLTPEQRQELETLRHKKPEEIKPVVIIETGLEPEVKEEKPDIGGIYLNGFVYRKDGKSTAWVNDSNSNQGDFGHRYLEINPDQINPENVEIRIPSANKKLKMKVGDYYEPESFDSDQ